MRIQFMILIFIACLNLATGLIVALSLPGTTYFTTIPREGQSVTEIEDQFNATELAERWQATPYTGIPVVGDIFSGFYLFFNVIRYLIDGFPMLLTWISDNYIISTEGVTAFNIIANTLRAIYAIMMAVFVIEFITGRRMPD